MAKKDRFPDAYSGGFPPGAELGSSGRDHMETSGSQKKWIKLSSAFHDGFGVPIRNVPLSTLPSSDKHKWLLCLRSELDHIRTFQKKADMYKAQKTHSLKQGVGERIQSVNEPVPQETFNLLLRKQCENLLKKLMLHQHSWVFNKPVDVVALKIPDYFNVIKKPMDLGTVKEKLGSGKYSSPFQFADDVRLTFSNAMTYNPPGNDVHIMANVISNFFELRWKPIEKKLTVNGSQKVQQPIVHEEIELLKPMPCSKKRKITSIQPNPFPEPVKLVTMTNDEKHSLSRELETYLGDLPDNIIDFLRKHGSNKNEDGEDEIEIDIDDLNDETLFELRKMLDHHIREKQKHAKAEPCVIELLKESGLSNSTIQLYKENDFVDEDVEVSGNEPPASSYPPVELDKGTNKNHKKQATSGTSNVDLYTVPADSHSSGISENEVKDVKASTSFSGTKEIDVAGADLSQKKSNSIESDSLKDDDDGDGAPNERQVSPDKLYRAALLKNRFADTIFKAREKTLNQDEKADPEKLRLEKELLENQRRKEKAKLQAEAKAAEDARRQVEAKVVAQAKRKRNLEREAARQALLKIEKTVEIDETSWFLKDLELLRTADSKQLIQSSLDDTSPEHQESQDGLGTFKFGSSNPLEQLGLYMKTDDEHEDDEEPEPDPAFSAGDGPRVVNNDVEEGEIN